MGLFPFTKIVDLITSDHKNQNVESESRCGHRNAPIVQDEYTNWIQNYPMKTKRNIRNCVVFAVIPSVVTEAGKHLQRQFEKYVDMHNRVMTQVYLIAQKRTEWHKGPSVERKEEQLSHWCNVTYLKNGGTVRWNCFCHLRNVHIKVTDGHTSFQERFDIKFDGLSIPWGSLLEYIPITANVKSRIHQFGKETARGVVLGSKLRAGGGWSGKLLVADFKELQESEVADIYFKRSKRSGHIRVKTSRISVYDWNFKTVQPPKTIIDCWWRLSARRWWWNRRRRQERRFHKYLWSMSGEHVSSWRTSIEALRLRRWNNSDPIEIRRRDETNEDKY